MRLRVSDSWVDYDLNLYLDIARPIDEHLDRLFDVIATDYCAADMFDYPLTVDHLLGVGLVAAQVYVKGAVAEQAAPLREALSIGPRLPSGAAVVQLVNDGANFWKHCDASWNWDAPDHRQRLVLRALANEGIDGSEYVLVRLIRHIAGTERPHLSGLSLLLEEWRNVLDEVYPEEQAQPER